MNTTTLSLTLADLCILQCALGQAQAQALADAFTAPDDIARRAADRSADAFGALFARLRSAEEALRLRSEDYPPGKVRPPRAWPDAPERTAP